MAYQEDPDNRPRPRVAKHEEFQHGKRRLEVTEIERRDGSATFLARRDDARKPFGNFFSSVRDVEIAYPSWADEIDRKFRRK